MHDDALQPACAAAVTSWGWNTTSYWQRGVHASQGGSCASMEKNTHVAFCRKALARLALGTPFMKKQLQQVSSNDCSEVLCCPQVLLFSNSQIFKACTKLHFTSFVVVHQKRPLQSHWYLFSFFTFHVAKILLEKWAHLKCLRKTAGSIRSCLSVLNARHPAKQSKQQLSASAVGHGWTLTSLGLKLAIN